MPEPNGHRYQRPGPTGSSEVEHAIAPATRAVPVDPEQHRRAVARQIWADWVQAGSPAPYPPVKLPLTLAECAEQFGTTSASDRPTPDDPALAGLPIVPAHVEVTDLVCPRTSAPCPHPAPTPAVYAGSFYCARDCAALDQPDHPDLRSQGEPERAREAFASRLTALEREIADLRATLQSSPQEDTA